MINKKVMTSIKVYACRRCAFGEQKRAKKYPGGKLALIGLSPPGAEEFDHNGLIMTCPVCKFSRPKYELIKNVVTGKIVAMNDQWLPTSLPSIQQVTESFEIVREPSFIESETGELQFFDDLEHGRYNDIHHRSPRGIKKLINKMKPVR